MQKTQSHLDYYISKQNKFNTLVQEISKTLNSKEYMKLGYSFDDYVKMKWDISKAQAYRYLLCAKVINQLDEFKIIPNYERLCRSLYKYAKKPEQLKLLWKTILEKSHGRPDTINTSHVGKIWKQLCMDKRYCNMCKNEEDIMNKIEMTLNKYSNNKMLKQINKNKNDSNSIVNNINNINTTNININNNNSYYHSPINGYSNQLCLQNITPMNEINNKSSLNTTTYIPLSPPISECSYVSNENIKTTSIINPPINSIPYNMNEPNRINVSYEQQQPPLIYTCTEYINNNSNNNYQYIYILN